jgi:ribose transport system substrate-binding protein
MVLVLESGQILFVNERSFNYFDLSSADAWADVFSQRIIYVQRLGEDRRKAFASGMPFENEQRRRGKDGKYRSFLVRYHPLKHREGRLDRVLALVVIFCALTMACQAPSSRTIAVIPRDPAVALWESSHKGAVVAGQKAGFHIYWNAPTREDDIERQIELVEKAVELRPAGLVLVADHDLALLGPVRRALSAHIPTVVISSPLPLPPGHGLSYILNDDEEMGRLAASRMGTVLKGRGKVAMVGLTTSHTGIRLRARAFEEGLDRHFPGITIVARGKGSPNVGEVQQAIKEILMQHPDVKAILALDAISSRGALAALRSGGKIGSVHVVGCDQDLDLMFSVRLGEMDSVIAENSNEMGALAVEWIAARNRGEAVPGKVEIKPVLVSKANIDEPEIQKLLAVDWRSPH